MNGRQIWFFSVERLGFETATPKIIAGVTESATYRLKEVQRLWRKIHSPMPF
jgi:hypothetical protein